MAGAELRHLAHEPQARRGDGRLDLLGAMARDGDDPIRPQRGGGLQNMLQ
jgi:hypothetical protein